MATAGETGDVDKLGFAFFFDMVVRCARFNLSDGFEPSDKALGQTTLSRLTDTCSYSLDFPKLDSANLAHHFKLKD